MKHNTLKMQIDPYIKFLMGISLSEAQICRLFDLALILNEEGKVSASDHE